MAIITRRHWSDESSIGGPKKLWHFDTETEQATEETIFDAQACTDANKAVAAMQRGDWKGDMHLVASIPLPLYWQLKREGVIDDPKRFKAFLNDRDNQLFRVKPGKV